MFSPKCNSAYKLLVLRINAFRRLNCLLGDVMLDSKQRRRWYAVYSKPQREDYAKCQLESKRLEVFFPKLFLPYATRKQKSVVPLFPNYLFARIDISSCEYYSVIWSPGVRRLVSFNGCPAPIDDQVVEVLMQQAGRDGRIVARSSLDEGNEVQITGGPFDGLRGIIQNPPSEKGRVMVLLNFLNRQSRVELPVRHIESSWIAGGAAA